MATQPRKFYGYTAAVFLIVMMFCIYGVFAVFSTMMNDIMIRLNIDAAQLGMAITVRSIAGLVVSIFAYKIYPIIKPNMCMIISAVGMVIMVASFLWGPLWSIYVTSFLYGFCMGTGMQVGMPVYVSSWFVDRRDEIIGYGFAAVNGGTAIAAVIFGILAANFDNYTAATIMMILFGGLSIICSFFLRNPDKMGQKPLGFEKISAAEADAENEENLPGLTAVETRKTPAFWILTIALLLGGLSTVGCSYTTVIVGTCGFSASDAAYCYSCFAGASAVAMMVFGNISSRIGAKPFMVISAVVVLVSMALYAYSTVSGWDNLVIYMVICGGVGVGMAGFGLYASLLAPQLFGERSIKGTTPLLQNTYALGSGFGTSLLTPLVALTGTWTLLLVVSWFCAAACAALAFVSLKFAPIKKWRLEHPNFAEEVAARMAASQASAD